MIVNADDFIVSSAFDGVGIVERAAGKKKKVNKRAVFDIVGAFDIETTTLHFPPEENKKYNDHAFMYIWMWQIGADYTVIGRTWEQFLDLAARIRAYAESVQRARQMTEPPLFVSYVHNLSFEWQFFAGIYRFESGEVFATEPRKILYCRMFNTFEFRCSYKLSNMSLSKFLQSVGAHVQKQSGQRFDYSKVRYSDTALSDYELLYCVNDVISLQEAITLKMEKDSDDLLSIPLTSTGYVRRVCKEALAPIRRYKIAPILPDIEQYKMLRAAFRGGNTHAAALSGMVGKVLQGVESYDMSSCYPAQQLTKKFPMERFQFLAPNPKITDILGLIKRGRAVVATYDFANLRLKDPRTPIPYISLSKCESVLPFWDNEKGERIETGIHCDNGRVVHVGTCRMTITEIDLEIILKTYKFDYIKCIKAMKAKKDYLPKEYREVIQNYYNYKTSMKAQAETDEDVRYMYNKSKNMLNAIYGMSAQDPIHEIIEFMDGMEEEWKRSGYDDDGAAKRLFLANFPYQLGVYTTALARAALEKAISIAGDKMVYCDTDSVKTLGHVDFSALNDELQALAESMGAHCPDSAGVQHYVGVFENEGCYDGGFITQGAKRYAYIKHGEMGVTVSGVTHMMHERYNSDGSVNKKESRPWCVEELGALENFCPGMTWVKAGGTASVYNDDDDFIYHSSDGHVVHITRNVAIVDTTYTLQYATDYRSLLEILDNEQLYSEWRKARE